MKKEKVAFVVVRYGKNINGGAEYHCQMLAERLVSDYDVEVLTTCVRDVATGENIYPEGEEEWNGVVIRRFRTKRNAISQRRLNQQENYASSFLN